MAHSKVYCLESFFGEGHKVEVSPRFMLSDCHFKYNDKTLCDHGVPLKKVLKALQTKKYGSIEELINDHCLICYSIGPLFPRKRQRSQVDPEEAERRRRESKEEEEIPEQPPKRSRQGPTEEPELSYEKLNELRRKTQLNIDEIHYTNEKNYFYVKAYTKVDKHYFASKIANIKSISGVEEVEDFYSYIVELEERKGIVPDNEEFNAMDIKAKQAIETDSPELVKIIIDKVGEYYKIAGDIAIKVHTMLRLFNSSAEYNMIGMDTELTPDPKKDPMSNPDPRIKGVIFELHSTFNKIMDYLEYIVKILELPIIKVQSAFYLAFNTSRYVLSILTRVVRFTLFFANIERGSSRELVESQNDFWVITERPSTIWSKGGVLSYIKESDVVKLLDFLQRFKLNSHDIQIAYCHMIDSLKDFSKLEIFDLKNEFTDTLDYIRTFKCDEYLDSQKYYYYESIRNNAVFNDSMKIFFNVTQEILRLETLIKEYNNRHTILSKKIEPRENLRKSYNITEGYKHYLKSLENIYKNGVIVQQKFAFLVNFINKLNTYVGGYKEILSNLIYNKLVEGDLKNFFRFYVAFRKYLDFFTSHLFALGTPQLKDESFKEIFNILDDIEKGRKNEYERNYCLFVSFCTQPNNLKLIEKRAVEKLKLNRLNENEELCPEIDMTVNYYLAILRGDAHIEGETDVLIKSFMSSLTPGFFSIKSVWGILRKVLGLTYSTSCFLFRHRWVAILVLYLIGGYNANVFMLPYLYGGGSTTDLGLLYFCKNLMIAACRSAANSYFSYSLISDIMNVTSQAMAQVNLSTQTPVFKPISNLMYYILKYIVPFIPQVMNFVVADSWFVMCKGIDFSVTTMAWDIPEAFSRTFRDPRKALSNIAATTSNTIAEKSKEAYDKYVPEVVKGMVDTFGEALEYVRDESGETKITDTQISAIASKLDEYSKKLQCSIPEFCEYAKIEQICLELDQPKTIEEALNVTKTLTAIDLLYEKNPTIAPLKTELEKIQAFKEGLLTLYSPSKELCQTRLSTLNFTETYRKFWELERLMEQGYIPPDDYYFEYIYFSFKNDFSRELDFRETAVYYFKKAFYGIIDFIDYVRPTFDPIVGSISLLIDSAWAVYNSVVPEYFASSSFGQFVLDFIISLFYIVESMYQSAIWMIRRVKGDVIGDGKNPTFNEVLADTVSDGPTLTELIHQNRNLKEEIVQLQRETAKMQAELRRQKVENQEAKERKESLRRLEQEEKQRLEQEEKRRLKEK